MKKNRKITALAVNLIAGASLVLLLSGCGKTDDEAQESPEIQETAEIGEDAENRDSTDAEENTEPAARVVEALNEDGEVIDDNTEHSARDYLKYMSEEELRELAAEALDEKGKDTSLADNRMNTSGLTFEIPDGFTEHPDKKNFYVMGRYPIDASSIYYTTLEPDYTLQLMEEEAFKALMEESFLGSAEENVEVDITEYTPMTIDDIPAFRIMAEYDLGGAHLEQLIYLVNGSKTYVLIYTQTDEYDRMELFEASAETIHVEK